MTEQTKKGLLAKLRNLEFGDVASFVSHAENAIQYGLGPVLRLFERDRTGKSTPTEPADQPIVEGRVGRFGFADEGIVQLAFADLREEMKGVRGANQMIDRFRGYFASEVARIKPLEEKVGTFRAHNAYKEYANAMRVMLSGIKSSPGTLTEYSQKETLTGRDQAERPTGNVGRRATFAFQNETVTEKTAKWSESSGGSKPIVDILKDWVYHFDRIWKSHSKETDPAKRMAKACEQFREERKITGMPMMPTPEEVLDHKKILGAVTEWLRKQNAKSSEPYDDQYLPFIVKYPRRLILLIPRLVVKTVKKIFKKNDTGTDGTTSPKPSVFRRFKDWVSKKREDRKKKRDERDKEMA